MSAPKQFDHFVVNVRLDMDGAERTFRELGFTLTPRGYHTLGSINHLMMFGTDYLELIGMPEGSAVKRPELVDAPVGLNGLVFKSADVDETFAELQALSMAGDPPKAFSRPVEVAGGAQDAKFRTVAARTGVFPAGRVYFCEHGTPELVWRPEWQAHANGATGMAEFVVVSTQAGEEAANYASLIGTEARPDDGCWRISAVTGDLAVMTPEAYGARFGDLALPMAGRSSMFGAAILSTSGADGIERVLQNMASPPRTLALDDGVALQVPGYDTLLVFRR
jgi:hypothetical protein